MAVLNTLLEITLYASIIVIVTLLLKKLLSRRMSPWLHYAVWFVLIARLMLPVTVESGFHVFTAPTQVQTQAATVPQASVPATSADSILNDNTLTQPIPIEVDDSQLKTVSPAATSVLPTARPLSTNDILLTIWLSGTGVCLAYIALLFVTLKRRVRRNAAEPSARLITLFNEVKAEMNIKARLKLVCQYEYGTPALLLPRTVLMPVDTLIAMDDEQIRFALRHELTHYRRGDHIACLLISLLNAVYWFNPFVWLAFRQMRADMEIACDSKVVQALDVPQKSRYASLIVGLFAQTERRQLVLGMAQGSAKKIAEQRVRGIFKEAKSHASVKLIASASALLLLVTCFTTACQPTPEKAVVVQRSKPEAVVSDSTTSSAPSATPVPSTEKSIKWIDQYNDDKGIFHVNIDATIETPDVTAYPVIEMKRAAITDAQLQKVANTFFGDKQILDGNVPRTKEQIENDIIQLKAQQQKMVESGNEDYYKHTLSYLEDAYNSAPETVNLEPAQAIWPDESGLLNIMCEQDDGYSYIRGVSSLKKDEDSFLEYTRYNSAYHETGNLVSQPAGVKMSEQDALTLVDQALQNIGLNNMVLAAEFVGNRLDDPENTTDQCYVFYYTRITENIPFTYVNTYNSDNVGDNVDRYAPHLFKEHISVSVNDNGIVNFYWKNPYEEVTRISDNARLLDLEHIKQIFMKQMQREAAGRNEYYDKTNIVSDTVYIYRVTLGYMPTIEKDNYDTYICIPVWNFFSTHEIKFSDATQNEEFTRDFGTSMVTINAMDGSLINGWLGY